MVNVRHSSCSFSFREMFWCKMSAPKLCYREDSFLHSACSYAVWRNICQLLFTLSGFCCHGMARLQVAIRDILQIRWVASYKLNSQARQTTRTVRGVWLLTVRNRYNRNILYGIRLWGISENQNNSSQNTPSTTNLEEEKIVNAPGKDGNAAMPEHVKRPNPWRNMMMMVKLPYSFKRRSLDWMNLAPERDRC
jgi:hypothetical protein